MTNEWLEFKAYTDKPTYFSSGKRDFSYLGRFHLKALLDLEGLGRILTIIARGYLFHDKDGNVLKDNAYSRNEFCCRNVIERISKENGQRIQRNAFRSDR